MGYRPFIRRKRTYKRRASRYRRRRTMNISRPMRMSSGILNMKRTVYQGSWAFNNTTTSGFWQYLTWTMNTATSDFSEIQALFDEYKVNAIKVTFRPRYDSVDGGLATVVNPTAYAHYCIDPGSTVIPAGLYSASTLNTFLQNDNVKTRSLTKPFSIYFRPKVVDQVGGGGTASRSVQAGWIRTTESGVTYRGVHVFLQNNNMTSVNGNLILDQFVTLYYQVRNLR